MQSVSDEVLGTLPQNWYTNHQGKNIQQMCKEQEYQKNKQEKTKALNAENKQDVCSIQAIKNFRLTYWTSEEKLSKTDLRSSA